MRNLSLRTRLVAGFLLPILFLIVLALGTIFRMRSLGSDFEMVAAYDLALVSTLGEVKYYGSRVISSTNELILDYAIGRDVLGDETAADESDETDQIEDARAALWEAFSRYQALITIDQPNAITTSENQALAQAIEAASQVLVDDSNSVIALKQNDADLWAILEIRTNFESAETTFIDAVDRAIEHEMEDLNVRREIVHDGIRRSLAVGTTLAVGAILLIVGISQFTYRSISKPLSRLQRVATAFSRGNLDVRTGITSNDELGQVAHAFDHMARDLEISINELETQTIEAVLAREQAERSDRVKSQFLASVSHELRTPLNAVLNFTQFVSSGMMGEVNERQVEALNKVYNSGAHLLDLINDVLDISKIEANSLQLFVEDNVDLSKEMGVVIDVAESTLKGKPVRLNVDIPPDLPLITGDRQRIRQVMFNLVGNACKFTDEGNITLKLAHVGADVVFAVSDTGPGISPEEQEDIYNPFLQGNAGLKHGGTGLGLPISKRLIDAHGGTIRLETEPGKGTTFYVTLPVHSPALTPVHA